MKKMSLPSGRKSRCASGSHRAGCTRRSRRTRRPRGRSSRCRRERLGVRGYQREHRAELALKRLRDAELSSQSRQRPGGTLVVRARPRSRRCRSRARSHPRANRIPPGGGARTRACPRAPKAARPFATRSVRLRCGRAPTAPMRPCYVRCTRAALKPAARATRDGSQSRPRCGRARLSVLTGATSTRYRYARVCPVTGGWCRIRPRAGIGSGLANGFLSR